MQVTHKKLLYYTIRCNNFITLTGTLKKEKRLQCGAIAYRARAVVRQAPCRTISHLKDATQFDKQPSAFFNITFTKNKHKLFKGISVNM